MRRGFIVGLGAIAVFLWWQPWRRFVQQRSSHRREGVEFIDPLAPSPAAMPSGASFSGSFAGSSSLDAFQTTLMSDAEALLDTPASSTAETLLGASAIEQNTSTAAMSTFDETDLSMLEDFSGELSTDVADEVATPSDFSEFSESLNLGGVASTSDNALSDLFDELEATSDGDVDASLVAESGMVPDIIGDIGAFDGFEDQPSETIAADNTSNVAGYASNIAGNTFDIADEASMPDDIISDAGAIGFDSQTSDSGGDSDASMVAETGMAPDVTSDAGAFDGFDGVAVDESGTVAAVANTGDDAPSTTTPNDRNADTASTSSGSSKIDQLIVIEGVGPKISTILTAAGLTTFAQLAEADVDHLNTILRDAGITTANPSTWAQQAQLAAEGKMDELKQLQSQIKNGRLQS